MQKIETYLLHPSLLTIYENLKENGITVIPTTYTSEIAQDSLCKTSVIDWDDRIWGMSVIDNQNLSDDILCHELTHLILIAEGFPCIASAQNIHLFIKMMLSYINNMVHHLEVWRLTEKFCLSEAERYDRSIRHELFSRMTNLQEALPDVWLQHPYPQVDGNLLREAYYIAAALLSPCHTDTKKDLRQIVEQNLPNILPLVDQLVEVCHTALPLTPESALTCLGQLTLPLQPPPGSMQPLYLSPSVPGLRAKILSEVQASSYLV